MDVSENSIDYWEWLKTYRPISNHLDKTAAIDGCLFLPFGKQWYFVNQYNYKNIWTLIVTDLDEGDGTLWEISSGMHYVNAQGYLVTENPYFEDMNIIY